MSEFNFYDKNGNRFEYPENTIINSNLKGDHNEPVENIIDNNVNTKYCSSAWGGKQTGNCSISIDLGINNYIDINNYMYYAYYTANDVKGRDPVSWIISGSNDGEKWIILDSQNDQIITDNRKTKTQNWTIN